MKKLFFVILFSSLLIGGGCIKNQSSIKGSGNNPNTDDGNYSYVHPDVLGGQTGVSANPVAPPPSPSVPVSGPNPAPPAPLAPVPVTKAKVENGVATITVSAKYPLTKAKLNYSFAEYLANPDGTVTLTVAAPQMHMLNADAQGDGSAIQDGVVYFNLYVNGVKLESIRPGSPNGGMFYFFVLADGTIKACSPEISYCN